MKSIIQPDHVCNICAPKYMLGNVVEKDAVYESAICDVCGVYSPCTSPEYMGWLDEGWLLDKIPLETS